MDKTAYHYRGAGFFCAKCWPGDARQRVVIDESKIVKREALLGRVCEDCGIAFLSDGKEPDPFASERAFKNRWAADVAAGKAFPAAGDLFDTAR